MPTQKVGDTREPPHPHATGISKLNLKIARKPHIVYCFDTLTHVKEERAVKISYKLQKHYGIVNHKHTSN